MVGTGKGELNLWEQDPLKSPALNTYAYLADGFPIGRDDLPLPSGLPG